MASVRTMSEVSRLSGAMWRLRGLPNLKMGKGPKCSAFRSLENSSENSSGPSRAFRALNAVLGQKRTEFQLFSRPTTVGGAAHPLTMQVHVEVSR